MPRAWTCLSFPEEHGTYPQSGLTYLADNFPELQPQKPFARFACPKCIAIGCNGQMRSASETEVARLATQTAEV